ncbi:MAG: CPBP family intramembrane metalloprotease, partial [Actinobacteria bacterium]|nr:CPBP family intramembrane metalloprotease [Actinomycetota bacterium]
FRIIVICILIAAVSLLFVIKYFYKAFPEASIDFKVTRVQSRKIAAAFLQKIHFDDKGYRHSVIFDYDNQAKTFLEKELGAEKANTLMGSTIRLWWWSNRWYKPLQKEEISVHVSPSGELIAFDHLLPEEAIGASLPADSAKSIAMDFLTQTMGLKASDLEFVEKTSQQRPKRTDHTFIWKEKGFEIRNATYRYKVQILGDQVGAYYEYLHVPEKWQRDYQKLRAKNNTTANVSFFFLFLTLFAMLVMLIVYTRHRDIRWRTAAWFGIVAAVLTFLSSLNNLPVTFYNYATTDPLSGFILREIVIDLVNALLSGAGIFFLTAAAEPLYREKYKNQLSLTRMLSWRGLRTKKSFIAILVGLTMTIGFAAYQVVFYLTSQKLGGWAPQDIPYDNLLNTAFPWISVLLIGFMPAVTEEFISRMFSIPFFEKFIKVRWLSVVIPAFIWGFAHANYPNQPFYIRGLEVGTTGIIVGIIMLRFGILATLVWHYTVDAFYTALVLLRSGNPYFVGTAAIGGSIMLLPLIIAIVAYIKSKSFSSEEGLTNAAEGTSHLSEVKGSTPETNVPSYQWLSWKRLALGFVIGLLLFAFYFLKTDRFGDFVKFPTGKKEAKIAALKFLQSRNFDVSGYKSVVYASERFSSLAAKYVLENSDIKRLNKLYSSESKGSRWGVRFFKPLVRKEYNVFLDPRDLSLVSFDRIIEEDAPGADIPQDSALVIAIKFAASQSIDVGNLDLKEASSEKRKNRRDYTFIWEAKQGDARNIAELKYRVMVRLQGNVISTFTTFPKLPESWQRARQKRTAASIFLMVLKFIVLGMFLLFAIIRFIKSARVGDIAWKKSLVIAALAGLVFLAERLLNMGLMQRNYSTSIDMSLFTMTSLIGILISAIAVAAALGISLGLVSALYPQSLQTLSRSFRKLFSRDAVLISIIAALGFAGILRLNSVLLAHFSKAGLINSLPIPVAVDSLLPFFTVFKNVVLVSILFPAMLGTIIFVLQDVFKKPLWIMLIGIAGVLSFIPADAHTMAETLLAGIQVTLLLAWIVVVVISFAKKNFLAYMLMPVVFIAISSAAELVKQGNRFLFFNGILLIVVAVIFILWCIAPILRKE